MTLKRAIRLSTIISGIIIVLMVILRHEKSELFTFLSVSLGGTILFTLLYYLFTTEKIKRNTRTTKYKYIFYAVSIPLLFYSVQITRQTDGFLKETVRILLAIVIFYLIFSWFFGYRKSIQKLKHDKLEAELMLLKNQINPHFFFNTLNNLYSLIKKDSNAAQDYVLKLSDLMRFTIYDSGKKHVILKDEVDYLINFIDLQTARYHKEIDIDFVKIIENENTKIAPLLFIILLENAFKHGAETVLEDAFVHLKLIENTSKIIFTIKNNFDPSQINKNKGIGIQNLKDRLNILYPNTHQLTYNINEDVYTSTLAIDKK